jgi:hypothetical protein
MPSLTVIVTGSRSLLDQRLVFDALDLLAPTLVVEGGCPTGADYYARQWRDARGLPKATFKAQWTIFGNAAGPIRNRDMLRAHPDAIVLAFPRGGPGTADCIEQATARGMTIEAL